MNAYLPPLFYCFFAKPTHRKHTLSFVRIYYQKGVFYAEILKFLVVVWRYFHCRFGHAFALFVRMDGLGCACAHIRR